MQKIKEHQQVPGLFEFYCPGCDSLHAYFTKPHYNYPVWGFNGSLERPTFTPSLLNTQDVPESKNPDGSINWVRKSVCHLFVTDGMIIYCNDCTHLFAGQTVELTDIEEALKE